MSSELKAKIIEDLKKSKAHLSYSYVKVTKLNFTEVEILDEETLETLESFSSRFARYSDLLISKYFRYLAKENDPAFKGSPIDVINLAEKNGWIQSAEVWKRIRELRNVAAHEYAAEDYKKLYAELVKLCPALLEVQY